MTTFYALRDADNTGIRRTDEDRAMAHAVIYDGESLDGARVALAKYMRDESRWLIDSSASAKSVGVDVSVSEDRAKKIWEATLDVLDMDPEPGKRVTIHVAGLIYTLGQTQ